MLSSVVVAVFSSRKSLVRALDFLMEEEPVTIKRAAIVAKAHSGETVILDDDLSPDEGGIAGGTLGAAVTALGLAQLGALALPGVGPIIALGTGALAGALLGRFTGRLAANVLDFGFRNEQITALSERLEAGHPALVLDLDNAQDALPILRDALKAYRVEWIEPLHRANMKPSPGAPADLSS